MRSEPEGRRHRTPAAAPASPSGSAALISGPLELRHNPLISAGSPFIVPVFRGGIGADLSSSSPVSGGGPGVVSTPSSSIMTSSVDMNDDVNLMPINNPLSNECSVPLSDAFVCLIECEKITVTNGLSSPADLRPTFRWKVEKCRDSSRWFSKKLADAFQGFMAVLATICSDDQDEETKKRENFQVTEWANRSDGDLLKPYDIMILRLLLTYEKRVPTKGSQESSSGITHRPRNKKSSTQEDVSMDSVGVSPAITTDASPHELYAKLTEGTLFSAQISLHTFIFGGRISNKLQIHNPGYVLRASPQKHFKMEKDEEVNKASDAFNAMSPNKKART
ncbi:hypothetical protein B0H15DRAFT_806241 [Mycena belliarum]|uniref:Uncharacterized protein n=1 Tax=Mycena belliarum TaxID=1033014 RepID=A0AAD6XJ99_9AGAR|nr:hypothetical protein B0H15DRAFT_806241 [Mycena belliae]